MGPMGSGNSGVVGVLIIAAIASGLMLGGVGFMVVSDSDRSAAMEAGISGVAGDSISMQDERAMVSTLDTDSVGAFVFLATYSKYNDVSVLEHELREEILGIVAAAPGIYFAHLVGRTGKPESTVRYHTKILEREGELQTQTILGNLRLFSAEVPSAAFAYLAAKRNTSTRRVLEGIERSDGPTTTSVLADMIDRAPSTVSYHLSRLEEESVITKERKGEVVQIRLAEELARSDLDRWRRPSINLDPLQEENKRALSSD